MKEEPMCSACISTVTLAVLGSTSTGGLAAFLASRFRALKRPLEGSYSLQDGASPKLETEGGD
jgi:hypothetical protein